MTIDDIIAENHVVRLNPPDVILGIADKCIESVCQADNIDMKVIWTDYAFPRILQVSKRKPVLIWDQTYWEMYRMFLMGLADLNLEQKKENIIVNTDFGGSTESKILVPFTYYLSLAVKNQSVATKFAYYYNQERWKLKIIRLGMSLSDFSEYIEIAKMYVAVHEKTHLKYKKKNLNSNRDFENLKYQLNIAKTLFMAMGEDQIVKYYLNSKRVMLEIVQTAIADGTLQEEILCDTYALNMCMVVYKNSWSKRYTEKEIITKCLEAVRIVNYFNSVLISLKTFWEDCCCNIEKIDILRFSTTQRMYISEMVFAMQLVGQGLYEDSSLWKFDGFENNYILENIIYSCFFEENAVSYWKKPITVDNEDSFDKFDLLDWRIKHES